MADYVKLVNQNRSFLEEAQQSELSKPLVSAMLPLADELKAQFPEPASIFAAKSRHLAKSFNHIVFVRRDGNCFVRGFATGLLLHLRKSSALEQEEILATFQEALKFCAAHGYEEFIVEDFHEMWLEIMHESIRCESDESVLEIMRDDSKSSYAVMLFRCIIGASMRASSESYLSFLPDVSDIDSYVKEEIDPMGRESEESSILALSSFAKLTISIQYLDLSIPPGASASDSVIETNAHIFPLEGQSATPAFTLLYRPGHFDLIYP